MNKTHWTKVLGLVALPLIAVVLAVIVFTRGSGSDTNTTEAATNGAAMSIAVDPLDAIPCPPEKVSGETCVGINQAFDVIVTADARPEDGYTLAQAWVEYGATGLTFTNSYVTWPDIGLAPFIDGSATGASIGGLTGLTSPPPSFHKGPIFTFSFTCTSTATSHTLVLEPAGSANAGTFGALFANPAQFVPTTDPDLLVNCTDYDDDKIRSMGKFEVVVREEFRFLMDGYPGYDGTSALTSPTLVDRHTIIGRSAFHLDGDATDIGGAVVGTAGTIISDSDFSLVPAFEGPAGSREIHTEIRSMNLTVTVPGFGTVAVRAGIDAPDQPISPGEVESKDPSGATDFPADSFFNVFVEVDLPAFASFPGGTLFNSDPLLVKNENITTLPPRVIYIHGNSVGVNMYFKNDNLPFWQAGDLFGWLVLAGHGAGFDPVDPTAVNQFEKTVLPPPVDTPTPTPAPPKLPHPGDTDGDGCSDQRENGPDETLGGLRNWLNPNDYYDVAIAGSVPGHDGVIDLPNDILGVILHFAPTGAAPYDVRFDRGQRITGPVWNMTAPDGVIDLPNDILGVIKQFGHRCT